jgi:hypothetical protein
VYDGWDDDEESGQAERVQKAISLGAMNTNSFTLSLFLCWHVVETIFLQNVVPRDDLFFDF